MPDLRVASAERRVTVATGGEPVGSGGMVLIGIEPGPSMVGLDLNVTYSIIWSLALANIMGAGICMALAQPISRLTSIPFQLLAPCMIALICFAAFQATRDLGGQRRELPFIPRAEHLGAHPQEVSVFGSAAHRPALDPLAADLALGSGRGRRGGGPEVPDPPRLRPGADRPRGGGAT